MWNVLAHSVAFSYLHMLFFLRKLFHLPNDWFEHILSISKCSIYSTWANVCFTNTANQIMTTMYWLKKTSSPSCFFGKLLYMCIFWILTLQSIRNRLSFYALPKAIISVNASIKSLLNLVWPMEKNSSIPSLSTPLKVMLEMLFSKLLSYL